MGDESEQIDPSVACFSANASGLRFHDARFGPPPPASHKNSVATVTVVDTATPRGRETIRKLIGPTAEELLSSYPGRFVIHICAREGADCIQSCADEDLVILDVLKLVRNAPEPPAMFDFMLFVEPAFGLRVIKAVADDALRRSETGGMA
jgi:hypothetical protein